MAEHIINLNSVNPIEFYGPNNNKLKLLRKKYPLLKILSRGNQLKLSGTTENVETAKEKIELIISYIERNGNLSDNYFNQILGDEEGVIDKTINDELDNKILVFGRNGKAIKPKTHNQRVLVESASENDIIFAIGPAGTGKTYTAVALAVRALKNKVIKKIVLTRPAVEAGESLGFLPGDMKEKIDPFLRPLYDALDDMIPTDKLNYYMTNRIIEIAPLGFMRGRTLDNCYVILDEAQNTTDLQLKMLLTRLGPSAKAIITGDLSQVDLPRNQHSGLRKAKNLLDRIAGIAFVHLDSSDVVRHRLVKQIIKAYDAESEERHQARKAKNQKDEQKS